MKFLFVCDIPQVNGETFEVVCSLENMQFMRTNENITQEELEQVIETLLEHKKFDDANKVIDRIRAL